MTSAELSVILDLVFIAVLALLHWGESQNERFRSFPHIDLTPQLSKHSLDARTGEPISSWKGAAYSAAAIFLVLNTVALLAFGLAWLGIWALGSEFGVVFMGFAFVCALVVFLLQCPARIIGP